jgi:uncharacterized protein YjbI with pentapeptide repeats
MFNISYFKQKIKILVRIVSQYFLRYYRKVKPYIISIKLEHIYKLCKTIYWIGSFYVGLYYIASEKYEHRLTRLTTKVDNIVNQSDSEDWQVAIMQIPKLQHIFVPQEPKILDWESIYNSFFPDNDFTDHESVDILQSILVKKKRRLNDLNLHRVILTPMEEQNKLNQHQYEFANANFEKTNLSKAILTKLNFREANFQSADLDEALLIKSNFLKVNFKHTSLFRTNCKGAIFTEAYFFGALIHDSNFEQTKLIKTEFSNSSIMSANFSNAMLLGANLSNIRMVDKYPNNFQHALYNSKEISINDIYNIAKIVDTYSMKSCIKNYPKHLQVCTFEVRNIFQIPLTHDRTSIPPTQFFQGFDPKAHGMIDIIEVIEDMKEYLKES